MSKFRVGDKVRCIKNPDESNYQCKLGYEFKVENLCTIGGLSYIYPNIHHSRCFKEGLFELVPKVLDIKLLYKEL